VSIAKQIIGNQDHGDHSTHLNQLLNKDNHTKIKKLIVNNPQHNSIAQLLEEFKKPLAINNAKSVKTKYYSSLQDYQLKAFKKQTMGIERTDGENLNNLETIEKDSYKYKYSNSILSNILSEPINSSNNRRLRTKNLSADFLSVKNKSDKEREREKEREKEKELRLQKISLIKKMDS